MFWMRNKKIMLLIHKAWECSFYLTDGGYKGERCETSFHRCGADYTPCLNGATCIPGADYLDYTCECAEGKVSISVMLTTLLV